MSSLLSSNSKSIINAYIDNNSSAKSSIGLKISGKGFNDASNISNIYDNNGIGFQLLSNTSNYKELAIIDTSNNIYNSNFSSLRIALTEPAIIIKSITSNNNYKPLIINNNFTITNSNIGIGITNPQSALDIKGNLTLDGTILKLDGTQFNFSQWSNANANDIYYNQGFVGIGTTNPQSLLHLSYSLQTTGVNIRFTDATTGYTSNDGFIIGKDSNQSGLIWNYENTDIIIGTSNQERMRITSNGRIGIGTTNPQSGLDINGDVNIIGNLFLNNTNVANINNNNIKLNSNIFYYSNQELNISNFNINNNTLKLGNDYVNVSNLIINGNIYKSSTILENYWQRSSNNSNNIIYTQGYVGIGTTNPQFKLDIIGDLNITGKYKRNATDITVAGTSITFSDIRIKTNIIDINDDNALQQILTIEPKTYNYIDKEERGTDLVYGFIAQQIQEVIPHAVKIETQFIPNVYKSYSYINNEIQTNEDLTTILNINDTIRLKGIDNNYLIANIIDITSNSIKINKEINGNECFVYGKEVSDFHVLDKSYIYTLNVCAIQDLYKMIKELENKIELQETTINQLLQIIQPTIINDNNI